MNPKDLLSRHKEIKVYTDGSSFGAAKHKPKVAGWSIVWEKDSREYAIYGHCEAPSTNNVAEMLAVVIGLHVCGHGENRAVIYTDSQYVEKSLGEWRLKWEVEGLPTTNRGLIQALWDAQDTNPRARVYKIKGHKGIDGNERADALAKLGRDREFFPRNDSHALHICVNSTVEAMQIVQMLSELPKGHNKTLDQLIGECHANAT